MASSRKILTGALVLSLVTTLGVGLVPTPVSATTTYVVVEGRTGTANYTLADLQVMPMTQGDSSYQNSLGNWGGIGAYVGVSVSVLVNSLGGMVPGDTITVYASDGYNQTYSYNNAFNSWPDQTVQGDMIIAYSFNGATVPSWTNGLRVAFLPDDQGYSNSDCQATTTPDQNPTGLISGGARWVSSVAKIAVNTAPWNVTVKKDTATMTYGGQQIGNMTKKIVSAYGGYRKSSGTIVGPDYYTGVNASYLVQWVGGISSSESLKITSRDNYSQVFNYATAMGNDTVWTVLAYKLNGSSLAAGDVPRIAFIGPSWPVTAASLWQKAVSTLEVVPNQPPVLQPLVGVSGYTGQLMTFTASATDPDGDSLQYTWDFGDGSPQQVGSTTTHTYGIGGSFTFSVFVDDLTGLVGHNATSSATATIGTLAVAVTGRTGSVLLSSSDVLAMPATQGYSSYQNAAGSWRGAGTYVGVEMSELIGLVGGMAPGDTVTVYAIDGYNQTYSYYNVYDSWPDLSVQGTMILAYLYNGNASPVWPDAPRVAFLPSDQGYSNADCQATTTSDQNPSGTVSAGSRWVGKVASIVVSVAPWNVTIKKDTASIVYGGQQIANMTSVTAWGGYRKSSGMIVGPDLYTGVNVSYLLQWVHGMNSTDSLRIASRDAYEQTLNHSIAIGDSLVWPVLAYKLNGTALAPGDMPRLSFLGPDSPITAANLWQKAVSVIEVMANRAPVLQALAEKTGNASEMLTFTASATDADNDWLQYTWDFGDSTAVQNGKTVAHAFVLAGLYTVTVYVDDSTGLDGHNVSSSATVWVAFSINLIAGWNFVTVPLVDLACSASTLDTQYLDMIVSWDTATKTYDFSYVVGVSPPAVDFAIEPSTGYWIYTSTNHVLQLFGEAASEAQNREITLPANGGWANIGFASQDTTWTASMIQSMYSGGTVQTVSWFNPMTKTYQTYIAGISPSDFTLTPGQAYWCFCTAGGTLSYIP